jgi:VWFA-related protein
MLRRVLRPTRSAALLVAALAACVVVLGAQARELTIIVSALDRASGRPVDTLKPEDVAVREDDRAREVLRVTPVTEPMQLALLVDNSAAIIRDVPHVREGLNAFVAALKPGTEISLVTYAERPTLVTNLTQDRAELKRHIDRLFAIRDGGAYLMEAILESAQGFIKRESPRPVIVAVATDGVEFSNVYYETVLDRLKESGAQLHVVQVVSTAPDTTQEEQYRSIVIDRGTRDTGGRRDSLVASMALPEALRSLAAELNAQYKVVYARPESLIPPKEVKVTAAREGLEVRGVPMKTTR